MQIIKIINTHYHTRMQQLIISIKCLIYIFLCPGGFSSGLHFSVDWPMPGNKSACELFYPGSLNHPAVTSEALTTKAKRSGSPHDPRFELKWLEERLTNAFARTIAEPQAV